MHIFNFAGISKLLPKTITPICFPKAMLQFLHTFMKA